MKKTIAGMIAVSMMVSVCGCTLGQKSILETDSSAVSEDMTDGVSVSIVDDTEESINETEESEGENETVEETEDLAETISDEPQLDEVQVHSIDMLNYLATLSQEINSSKQSRMYLEEAYASIINDFNPEMIDEITESQLASMLDLIEKYRMIAVKRERLRYIYEQNQANAIQQAIPNPIGVLSAVSSFDMKRFVASIGYMAVDSVAGYVSGRNEGDLEFLMDNWELDDEEAENIHESRKRAFIFMIDIVREYNLPGKLALNETSVNDFVTWKNKTNTYQKIQFFESEKATYEVFDEYWLTLADCYYENAQYEKCLEAFAQYEEIHTNIFRKDRSLG